MSDLEHIQNNPQQQLEKDHNPSHEEVLEAQIKELQTNSKQGEASGNKSNHSQPPQDSSEPNYKKLYEEEVKKTAELTKQLEIERIKLKKMNVNTKMKGKYCSKCFNEIGQNFEKPANIVEDLKGFSTKIGTKIQKKNQSKSQRHNISNKEEKKSPIFQNNLRMFQNFTIFGINDSALRNFANEQHDPQLLYSLRKPTEVDHQAVQLVFPSGAAIKKLSAHKARDKAIEIMSYSYTHLKSFILRFKCQENIDELDYHKNQFLMHLNPEKQLFCLCIGINDYTSVDKEKSDLAINFSLVDSKNDKYKEEGPKSMEEGEFMPQLSNRSSSSSSQSGIDAIVSQRVFCITSYYPFFTFFEEILKNLINIVKMERLMIYKHKDEDIKASDSQFQLNRMKQLFEACMASLNPKKLQFNRSYELKLINHQKIALLTDWNLAKNYFVDGWIYSILSMFNVDTFIDVFTLLMLEDRIVFVCENSHILTYTIYLFVSLLTKPFMYAFEVVKIIPDEDFLGAPFPIVYGMLKKRKYLQERKIMQIYKNTYIFLSPDRVDVVCTENKKDLFKAKPMKLKNDLANIFKEFKRIKKGGSKSTKYEVEVVEYVLTSTIEERELAVSILEKVNDFMLNEVVNKLPNQIEIARLKNSIDSKTLPEDKDEHSYLMDQIGYSLRKTNKDPFFDRFLDSQMMSQYIFK